MGAAAKRRDKRKAAKAAATKDEPMVTGEKEAATTATAKNNNKRGVKDEEDEVVIEYVAAPLEVEEEDEANPAFKEFNEIFSRFSAREDGSAASWVKPEEVKVEEEEGGAKKEGDGDADDEGEEGGQSDSDDEEEDGNEDGLSKKARKLLTRMKVAELKQHCPKPEVVEVWDTTAADPRLLVFLKSYRNTIPVPHHWCQKRKFLQGKRGLEKPPWQLPSFIESTGIQKLRDSYAEKEEGKKLKQKTKDKATAKMGKIDIDYQVLHDAFFKYQTKPKMTIMGELYYEGKEYEMDLTGKKPGVLTAGSWSVPVHSFIRRVIGRYSFRALTTCTGSLTGLKEETRTALGMTEDGPPPWLINMQRYGPPPSYPNLKIPGLSAAIPAGAQFGYHPGGWGKPPVDEFGNPIYGDVFGVRAGAEHDDRTPYDVVVDKTKRWGAIEELSESEEEDSDEEDEDDEDAEGGEGLGEDEMTAGIQSMSSLQTSGLETPEVPLDLRKRSGPAAAADAPPQLYQVLATQETQVGADGIMGSAHTYVVPGVGAGEKVGAVPGSKARGGGGGGDLGAGAEISLNPEDLEVGMDDAAVAARYEAQMAAQRAAAAPEDFSDMVAEQAQRAKRKAAAKQKESDAKKFKF